MNVLVKQLHPSSCTLQRVINLQLGKIALVFWEEKTRKRVKREGGVEDGFASGVPVWKIL